MAEYRCTLSDYSAKKALEELHEDPKERNGAVQTLREWALQQKWLRTPTDTNFLLPFLRVRKFSQLSARENLVHYWEIREQHKELFKNLDPSHPKIQEFLDLGVYLLMPGLDNEGRKVLIDRSGSLDLSLMKTKFTVDDIFRVSLCMMEICMMDENAQVNGLIVFVDHSNFSHKHVEAVFGIENMKRGVNIWTNGYPMRYKGIHMYNMGPVGDALFGVIKMFMKEKIRKRIHTHGNSLVTVYDKVDMGHLPDEYLPDSYTGRRVGSIEHVISQMKKDFNRPEVVARIRDLASQKYGIDQSLKPKDDVPAQSFRKLNIS